MTKRDQLLHESLGENRGESFALAAAARVRRRRAARQILVATGAACAFAAVFLLSRPSANPTLLPPAIATPAPKLEIMSDQELLAQLKDQPVLILQDQQGIHGVIFLADGTKL